MNQRLIFITGVNKGLGKALFDKLVKNKQNHVIAVSRRLTDYQHKLAHEGTITFFKQDLLDLKAPEEVFKLTIALKEIGEIIFINNAGTIVPINRIGTYSNKDILNSLQINTFVPMAISNFLLNQFESKKISIINISSGAALKPIDGWGLYCSTKAANKMFFDTLNIQEEKNKRINVVNIDPGVIDSDMQKTIRSVAETVFPRKEDFVNLKINDKLLSPEIAARNVIFEVKQMINLSL